MLWHGRRKMSWVKEVVALATKQLFMLMKSAHRVTELSL